MSGQSAPKIEKRYLMNRKQVTRELERVQRRPGPQADELNWLQLDNVVPFLSEAVQGWVPLYVSSDLFLYSILIPEERLEGEFAEDILQPKG